MNESKAYSYNSEDWKSIGRSFLLMLTGVVGGYIVTGVWPAISLVLNIGDWSINLIPLIAAGIPFVVNLFRLYIRGPKIS